MDQSELEAALAAWRSRREVASAPASFYLLLLLQVVPEPRREEPPAFLAQLQSDSQGVKQELAELQVDRSRSRRRSRSESRSESKKSKRTPQEQ